METLMDFAGAVPMWAWIVIALIAVGLWVRRARNTVVGVARVRDGDSLVVDGHDIRIAGIDAPEIGQIMYTKGGPVEIGRQARAYMSKLVGRGGVVRAKIVGRDKYGRALAVCFNSQGKNLGRAMVRAGFARAYGYASRRQAKAYFPEQVLARVLGRGLWGKRMDWNPEKFRASKR